MRVARLDTGMAWAEDTLSRTRHLIGSLDNDRFGDQQPPIPVSLAAQPSEVERGG
jgi:Ring hydroxylating beta subunit